MTDWPIKTLGDICEVFDDGDWIESKDQASSGVRLIQTGNVGDGEFKNRSDKARFISEPTFSRLRCTEIFPGDLLVSRLPDPVGRACLIPETGSKMITAVDCTIMRPRKEIMLAQFLVLSTQTSGYRKQVRAKITGTTRDRISRSNLAEVQVAVPPLDEQKRIVALFDEATARVTELTACYEQARTHAKLLSGSLLVELLTNVEESEPMRLGDIAELKGRIGWRGLTAKEYTKEGPLFVSVHSLNYGHFVDLKDAFHISQERYDESPEIMLKNNDILICKDGAGIGKLGMVGQLSGPATINSSLLLIRASNKVRSEFLYFYLLSPIFQNLVQERLSGSTTPHLYQRDIAELVINLPSIETQDHLINQMWSALGRQGDLVECFNKQIDAMRRMRQSILEAAFAGEL